MQKYEKYPEIFEATKIIKENKVKLKNNKKELFELSNQLHQKKQKLKLVSSTFNKIKKEKQKDIKANFDLSLSIAKYQKTDINKLYDDYEKEIENLDTEYETKKINRIEKNKLDIEETKSKISSIKSQKISMKSKNKELKTKIKRDWIDKKALIKEEHLKLIEQLKTIKSEVSANIYEYRKKYKAESNDLMEKWKKDNNSLANIDYILKRQRKVRRIKRFQNELDQTIYDLSLKINEIRISYENQIREEKLKIKNQKLLIRYNAGKADRLTIKMTVDKVTNASGKLSNWKFMVALKNGFFSLMPLVIVGAVFILINNIVLGAANGGFFNFFYLTADELAILDKFKTVGSYIWNGTYAFFGFLLAGAIAYHLAPYYKVNQWSAAIVAFVAFLIMSPSFWTSIGVFGTSGMFTAMIISILSTVLFGRLSQNEKLKIRMPESVPDGVSKSFNILIPYAISAIFFGMIAFAITWIGQIVGEISIGAETVTFIDLNGLITVAIQKPMVNAVSGFGGMIAIVLLWQVLWFMGIHASGVLSPILEPIQLDGLTQNQQALAEGLDPEYVFTNPFMNNFIFMGGTGGTIGLILVILMFSKRGDYRSMAKVTLIPAIFCINEPLLFGLPLVLNPILFVPFVIGPLLAGAFAYFATTAGIIPYSSVMVPWTTPPILGGILTTKSFMGGIVAAINLVILMGSYTPFILLANKIEQRELLSKFTKKPKLEDINILEKQNKLNHLNS
ncbi:PTS transporter subunit EIIC [Spiroplasma cantharicola]|uniref:PTS system, cellobiose-specific IIC component n=1 Tax=Spiroplasma cantharicola TaxID=362837 RepID=A0A0M5KC58_9MOLU|nr:PTS transporter subunit EIIC [Spiroplasma cantharicola]ALD66113.1 PTS system, cellobiose-specific IIC component [Spiroplasma cantharicola]